MHMETNLNCRYELALKIHFWRTHYVLHMRWVARNNENIIIVEQNYGLKKTTQGKTVFLAIYKEYGANGKFTEKSVISGRGEKE